MSYCDERFLFSQFETSQRPFPEMCESVARDEEKGNLLSLAEKNAWKLDAMIHIMACPNCREKMQKANAITALRKSMITWIDPDWTDPRSTK